MHHGLHLNLCAFSFVYSGSTLAFLWENHCLCPLVFLASLPTEDQTSAPPISGLFQPTGSQKRGLRTLSLLGIQMSWDPSRASLAPFSLSDRLFDSHCFGFPRGFSMSLLSWMLESRSQVLLFNPVPRWLRLSLSRPLSLWPSVRLFSFQLGVP